MNLSNLIINLFPLSKGRNRGNLILPLEEGEAEGELKNNDRNNKNKRVNRVNPLLTSPFQGEE